MQETHGAAEGDGALPDEKSERPFPGWATTKAATAAAETAAAPTDVARTSLHRTDRTNRSDDHAGGTAVDSRSTVASALASCIQVTHSAQTPKWRSRREDSSSESSPSSLLEASARKSAQSSVCGLIT